MAALFLHLMQRYLAVPLLSPFLPYRFPLPPGGELLAVPNLAKSRRRPQITAGMAISNASPTSPPMILREKSIKPINTVATPLNASQTSPGISFRRRIASAILRMPVAIAQSQTQKKRMPSGAIFCQRIEAFLAPRVCHSERPLFSIVLPWHSAGAGARPVVNEPFTVVAVMPASSACTCRADRN